MSVQKIIADSGSTKTDWTVGTDGGRLRKWSTEGLNPFYHTDTELIQVIASGMTRNASDEIGLIYFYGAGCHAKDKKHKVKEALHNVYAEAEIHVSDDMHAAALALCGDEPGHVAILGTGANIGYYDGKNIVNQPLSLGFYLGDEGSGAFMGKLFVTRLLRDQLPSEIKDRVLDDLKMSPQEWVGEIYRQPRLNRYLASCTKWIGEYKEVPEVRALILTCFNAFCKNYAVLSGVPKNEQIHFTGSIAYFFKEILEESLQKYGYRLGRVHQNPMQGLIDYHFKF